MKAVMGNYLIILGKGKGRGEGKVDPVPN